MNSDVAIKPLLGIVRTDATRLDPRSSFWDLIGWRPEANTGRLEQLHPFIATQLVQGTYYDGASATEASASAITGFLPKAIVTDYVIWGTGANYPEAAFSSGTQLQCFYQVTQPAAVTINTHCLLVINSISGLAITLGNTIDIEIDAATTFRWRKNGGAWTAGVACSTAGTAIDGGNATVYFLIASGHTIGDLWQWRRTDRSTEGGTVAGSRPTPYWAWTNEAFFITRDYRVMNLQPDSAGTYYAISTGYRAVYGTSVTVFENHLFITRYTTSVGTAAVLASTSLACSDLNDLDCFFPTDVNEADFYTIQPGTDTQPILPELVGTFVFNDQIFVVTSRALYSSTYAGLPTPFSFKYFASFDGETSTLAYNRIVKVAESNIVFILGRRSLFQFDNNGLTDISERTGFYDYNLVLSIAIAATQYNWLSYDRERKEVLVGGYYTSWVCVYQLKTGSWYKIYSNFYNSGLKTMYTADIMGASSRRCLRRATDLTGLSAAYYVYDAGTTTFGVPTIITQGLLGLGAAYTKELVGTQYITATSISVVNTNIQSGSNNQFTFSWYRPTLGVVAYLYNNALVYPTLETDASAVWTTASSDGTVSFPRLSFRNIAFVIQQVPVTSGKPTAGGIITELMFRMNNWEKPPVTR